MNPRNQMRLVVKTEYPYHKPQAAICNYRHDFSLPSVHPHLAPKLGISLTVAPRPWGYNESTLFQIFFNTDPIIVTHHDHIVGKVRALIGKPPKRSRPLDGSNPTNFHEYKAQEI